MSTCISMHGEYGSHVVSAGTAEERFVCSRCFVLVEDDLLDALDMAEKRIRAVEELFAGGPDTACRTVWQDGIECVSVPIADIRAALAVPTEETGGD